MINRLIQYRMQYNEVIKGVQIQNFGHDSKCQGREAIRVNLPHNSKCEEKSGPRIWPNCILPSNGTLY